MSDPTPAILGLDLGQAQDYTALVAIKPDPQPRTIYTAGHIERVPLKSRYPDIVAHVAKIVAALSVPVAQEALELVPAGGIRTIMQPKPIKPRVTLVIDYTGVGRPVLDIFWEAQNAGRIDQDCDIVPVTITGGGHVTRDAEGLHVPKRDLVSVVQRILQEQRLEIPVDNLYAPVMTSELTGFRATIAANGHVSYGAGDDWRSAAHDDLVLSLALALWYAEITAEAGV